MLLIFKISYNFSEIIISNYYTNMKDREIADEIVSMTKDYEEETGNIITKMIVYRTEPVAPAYKNVRGNGDANVRLFYTDWGIQGILGRLLQRNITVLTKKNQEFEEYFKSQNFTKFDENQVKFNNDELHLYVV